MRDLGQRVVGQQVVDAAEELDLQLRLRRVGGALGHEDQPVVDGARDVDVRVAHVVVRLGEGRHDVRGVAAGGDHVVDARAVGRVLPQQLGAVVEDRHRVECGPARLGRRGSVSAAAPVAELGRHTGEVRRVAGGVHVARMPVEDGIHVVEQSGPSHECLGAATLLGGRSEEPHRAPDRAATDAVGYRKRRADGTGAEQMVSAGMAPVGSLARRARGNRFLGQPRQSVELGEDRDDRTSRAVGRDEARRDAGDPALNAEALLLDDRGEQGRGLRLLVSGLGPVPDLARRVPEQVGPRRDCGFQSCLLRNVASRAGRNADQQCGNRYDERAPGTPAPPPANAPTHRTR